jgi:hypothetical protein
LDPFDYEDIDEARKRAAESRSDALAFAIAVAGFLVVTAIVIVFAFSHI